MLQSAIMPVPYLYLCVTQDEHISRPHLSNAQLPMWTLCTRVVFLRVRLLLVALMFFKFIWTTHDLLAHRAYDINQS